MTLNLDSEAQGLPRRSANRRSEDELIEDLEAKIREVEGRMKKRELKASPLHKEFEKFKKQAAKFAQICTDEGRNDIANSVLGVLTVTGRQVSAID